MSDRTILIVDDEQAITDGVALRLQSASYRTMTADDGQQGVRAAVEHHPDLIVMDVRMPRMDGLAALKQLRSDLRTNEIPIVMLSASLRDQQVALDNGAQYFLHKPYRSTDLLAAVHAVFDDHPCNSEKQHDDECSTG